MLAYGDMGPGRKHWRQGRVPTPSSQVTTLDMLEVAINAEDESDEGADPDVPSDVECEPGQKV